MVRWVPGKRPDNCERLAVSVLQIIYRAMIAHQLLWIIALNVTAVILEKVGKLEIEQYGGRDVERYIKLDDALGRRGIASRRNERILGRRELGIGLR